MCFGVERTTPAVCTDSCCGGGRFFLLAKYSDLLGIFIMELQLSYMELQLISTGIWNLIRKIARTV